MCCVVEQVVGALETPEAEIFYGTEHPHCYGKSTNGLKTGELFELQASGITVRSVVVFIVAVIVIVVMSIVVLGSRSLPALP